MKTPTKAQLQENNSRLASENAALIAFQMARVRKEPEDKITVIHARGHLYSRFSPKGEAPLAYDHWEADIHLLKLHRADGGYVMILEYSVEKTGRRLQHITGMSGIDFERFCSEHPSDRWQENNWYNAHAEYTRLQLEALK